MNTQDEDDVGLQEVELVGRLNKLTQLAIDMEIIVAGHAGIIELWRDYATRLGSEVESLKLQLGRAQEERDHCVRGSTALINVNKEYRAIISELRVIGGMAAYDRDRARDIAAALEEECAQCWGPIHSQLLNALHLGEEMVVDDVT